MAELTIPHTITNSTTADANELQQNYQAIRDFINTNVVHKDGSISMTGPLTLDGSAPSVGADPVTKEYVDALGTSAVTPNTIVRRDSNGHIHVGTPTLETHPVPKKYVDDRVGMGWTVVTAASGWSTASLDDSAFSLRYKKIGNVVFLSGAIRRTGSTASSVGSTICTLPSGFRPPGTILTGIFRIASNGAVTATTPLLQGATWSGSVSFPLA